MDDKINVLKPCEFYSRPSYGLGSIKISKEKNQMIVREINWWTKCDLCTQLSSFANTGVFLGSRVMELIFSIF